jgi:hypothetical protein
MLKKFTGFRKFLKAGGNGVKRLVLVQREMERGRLPLVNIPPRGRGFSRHGGYRSDVVLGGAQKRDLCAPFIVSMRHYSGSTSVLIG